MYMDTDSLIILLLLVFHAAAQGVVTVDDSDLSISFTGNWAAIGPGEGVGSTNAPSSVALDSTVHQTQDGAAEAVFSFTGTAISVYGLSNPGGELSMLYSIDHMSPTGQRGATLTSDGGPASCLWFSMEGLPARNHVLTMKMSTTPYSGAYFILDYIMFTTSTAVNPSSGISTSEPISDQRNTPSLTLTIVTTSISQGQSPSAAATADSPVVTALSISPTETSAPDSGRSSTQSQSHTILTSKFSDSISSTTILPGAAPVATSGGKTNSSNQSAPPNSHRTPVAAIVGAVLAIFLFVVILLFLWRRRRLRRLAESPQVEGRPRFTEAERLIQPFSSSLRTQPVFLQHHPESETASRHNGSGLDISWISELGLSSTSKSGTRSVNALPVEISTADNATLRQLVTQLQREIVEIQEQHAGNAGILPPDVEAGTNGVPPPYDSSPHNSLPSYDR